MQKTVKHVEDITFIWVEGKKLQPEDEPHWLVDLNFINPIKVYPPKQHCQVWKAVKGNDQWNSYFEGAEKQAFSQAVSWTKEYLRSIRTI